jgi:hypothetical protein
MKEKEKQQGRRVIIRSVRGERGLKIRIISQCPLCSHITGIVGNDKEPINFRPEYIEFTNGDLEKISEDVCWVCDKKNEKEAIKTASMEQVTA